MRPMDASRLLLLSVTKFRCRSNDSRNQMASVATKMTVNARCRKSRALSHRSMATLLSVGRR